MEFYYQNCRGLKTKLLDVKLAVLENDFDVICMCETWLNENIYSEELFYDKYEVYRCDRDLSLTGKHDGGGVLVAIKKVFNSRKFSSNATFYEDIWIKVRLANETNLFICVVYFPPSAKFDDYNNFLNFTSCTINNNPNNSYIILGDFNLSSITWGFDKYRYVIPVVYEGRVAEALVDTMLFTGLQQHNLITNNQNKILDLVISNLEKHSVFVDKSTSPLCKIDLYHPALQFQIKISKPKLQSKCNTAQINFRNLRYDMMAKELVEHNWNNAFNLLNVDESVDYLYEYLYNLISSYKYNQNVSSKNQKFPPWFSPHLISLYNKKIKFRNKFNLTKFPVYRNLFERYRKLLKTETEVSFRTYTAKMENNISSNPKDFFNYANSLKPKSDYPETMHYGDLTSNNRNVICNWFANHFQSVYDNDANDSSNEVYHESTNLVGLNSVVITEQEVSDIISQLDENKSSGPDSIPNFFIKKLKNQLALPLTAIFNKSLYSNTYPTKWKEAHIVPVFKKGSESANICNYRPISILNAFNKIFEKIMHRHIFRSISSLIDSRQHGFFRNRSTITNLLEFSENLFNNMDSNTQTDCIYTDFTKAFDKVNHRILISKLGSFGLSINLQRWFKSYLVDRMQYVKFNGQKSHNFKATSGVPQGSILGPLLFIIFINDIANNIKSSCLLYADDLKIFRKISSVQDCIELQSDLHILNDWCKTNQLYLNINKCSVISFARKTNIATFNYNINNISLTRVDTIKDLGIIFDIKLKFDAHVNYISGKAFKMMGFVLRRCKEFVKPGTLITLFYCYVRNHLEYGSVIWNPHYDVYSYRIERIQRKFTKHLVFKFRLSEEYISYEERLSLTKLRSLEHRRIILDELMLFKIINSIVDCSIITSINFYIPAYPTRNNQLFLPPQARTNIGFSSPVSRMQISHNNYFGSIDLALSSLAVFKKVLGSFVFTNNLFTSSG